MAKNKAASSAKPTAKKATRNILIQDPDPATLNEAIRDCDLNDEQAHELSIEIKLAVEDLRNYQSHLAKTPDRTTLIKKLKRIEKLFAKLNSELKTDSNLIEFIAPKAALDFLGKAVTHWAMVDAIRASSTFDQATKNNIRLLKHLKPDGNIAVKADVLAQQYAHIVLPDVIGKLHAPFRNWVDLDRQNKGGRPADFVRRHLIHQLALAAPRIIGGEAPIAATGRFVDLCTSVLRACGLPEEGIDKAIPGIIRQMRKD